MWLAARRTVVGAGALLGVLVYALQFQKSCGDSTPYQCVASLVGWMQKGLLVPRQDQAKSPSPVPAPSSASAPTRSAPVPPPPPSERSFTVVNTGKTLLMEFFATRCTIDNWGRDLLGKDVIPAGQRYVVQLDTDGTKACCHDLRARFEGGQQRMNMGVDVCTVGTWNVGN